MPIKRCIPADTEDLKDLEIEAYKGPIIVSISGYFLSEHYFIFWCDED